MLAYAGAPGPALGAPIPRPAIFSRAPPTPSGLLIRAHAIREVAFLDALRHDRSDAEVQRALEVRDDVFVRVVLGRVREVALEPRMHVRADQCRHDGLAREIDAARAGRQRQLTASADVGDDAALDDKGSVFHRRSAVAGNQPCALVERRGTVGVLAQAPSKAKQTTMTSARRSMAVSGGITCLGLVPAPRAVLSSLVPFFEVPTQVDTTLLGSPLFPLSLYGRKARPLVPQQPERSCLAEGPSQYSKSSQHIHMSVVPSHSACEDLNGRLKRG